MSVAPVRPLLLGQLLSMTYGFCLSYWRFVVGVALVCGTVGALLQTGYTAHMKLQTSQVLQTHGLGSMEQFNERMMRGDLSTEEQIQEYLEQQFNGMTIDEIGGKMRLVSVQMLRRMLPAALLYGIVIFLIRAVALALITALAIEPSHQYRSIVRRGMSASVPMIGVLLWSFLRSFAWIPFLGIIPAIILLPRFVFAPTILMRDHTGVRESVRRSYAASHGYWGKIVGNVLVAAVPLIIASAVVFFVVSLLTQAPFWLTTWIIQVIWFLLLAYAIVFFAQLALTVMAHPLVPSAAQPSSEYSVPVQPVVRPKKAPQRRKAPTAKKKQSS